MSGQKTEYVDSSSRDEKYVLWLSLSRKCPLSWVVYIVLEDGQGEKKTGMETEERRQNKRKERREDREGKRETWK